jgi:hypothetical protein
LRHAGKTGVQQPSCQEQAQLGPSRKLYASVGTHWEAVAMGKVLFGNVVWYVPVVGMGGEVDVLKTRPSLWTPDKTRLDSGKYWGLDGVCYCHTMMTLYKNGTVDRRWWEVLEV